MNTPPDSQRPEPRPLKPPRLGVGARLRAYFLAGILITAPISITFYLAWLFIGFVDRQVTPLIPEAYNPNTYLPFALPGLGLVVVGVFLTLVGALTAGFLGRFVVRIGERILARMPVIRSIYGAVKQIFETVLAQHLVDAVDKAVDACRIGEVGRNMVGPVGVVPVFLGNGFARTGENLPSCVTEPFDGGAANPPAGAG